MSYPDERPLTTKERGRANIALYQYRHLGRDVSPWSRHLLWFDRFGFAVAVRDTTDVNDHES